MSTMRPRNAFAGATITLRGNSTHTDHGVRLTIVIAPRRGGPFGSRYSATPVLSSVTGGAGTSFERSVHTPPLRFPTLMAAPVPTSRLMRSDACATAATDRTTYPRRAVETADSR